MRRVRALLGVVSIAGLLAAFVPAAVAKATSPTGWAGERLLDASSNDWEPAIAADPGGPFVYVLRSRFGPGSLCTGACPDPAMVLQVSTDSGQTWGSPRLLCPCLKATQQWDPQIDVVDDGTVYASWLQKMGTWKIVFSKSTDHGATWTDPVVVSGPGWADKDWLAASADGRDVYIAWDRDDAFVAVSHDGGATWSPRIQQNARKAVFLHGGGVVAPDGTVLFAAVRYKDDSLHGPIDITLFRSTDGGASWRQEVVDTVQVGTSFFLGAKAALAVDAEGRVLLVYSGSTQAGAPGSVWARSTTDDGATWTDPVELSAGPAGVEAGFPAAAGTGSGDFRVWFMDTSSGSWNTWYRRSTDGGATWSSALRISDATTGAGYKSASGFQSPYGDYGEIDVDALGGSVAVWGEAFGLPPGPGGAWFNRQV